MREISSSQTSEQSRTRTSSSSFESREMLSSTYSSTEGESLNKGNVYHKMLLIMKLIILFEGRTETKTIKGFRNQFSGSNTVKESQEFLR